MGVERSTITLKTSVEARDAVYSKETFVGADYWIVPVSMIVEGAYSPEVSNKEDGTSIFFSSEELKKSMGTWDGKPASLNHPEKGETITYPGTFNKHWIGFVFSSKYDEEKKRISADLWLNESRSKDVIDNLKGGRNIEVSIGAFGDIIEEKGQFNGTDYSYKITNMSGDHLAVLPNSRGACSWEDGCGIRAENTEDVLLVRSSARKPSYSGVEDTSWGDVDKSLTAFYRGYAKATGKPSSPVPSIEEMSSSAKSWIASKSLLGDSSASDFRDLVFFPVVNPSTNKLNLGALRAVLSGRGSQANISESARTSAQNKAKKMLEENTKVEAVESEPCKKEEVKGEEVMKKITMADIFANKDDYCPELLEELSGLNESRNDMIKAISSRKVNGLSLEESFLSAMSSKNLRKLDAMLHEDKKEEKVEEVKASEPANVDFSLRGSVSASKDEETHIEPAKIDW